MSYTVELRKSYQVLIEMSQCLSLCQRGQLQKLYVYSRVWCIYEKETKDSCSLHWDRL